MSWDSNREIFTRSIEAGKAFIAWRLPGEAEIQTMSDARGQEWDGEAKAGFLFAPFDTHRFPILFFDEEQEEKLPIMGLPLNLQSSAHSHYLNLVENSVQEIRKGTFHKIVGARVKKIETKLSDPFELFHRICVTYPDAFCHLIHHPILGIWIGASPELLAEVDESGLSTMALAGTQKSGEDAWGDKEVEEQGIVLEYIREILAHFGEELSIEERIRHYSGHLEHWMNRIRLEQDGLMPYLYGILDQLHPTPAVAGIPKLDAMEFIQKQEGFERSYYSGFLGPMNGSGARFYVNLRCLHADEEACELFAGAGLTADSDPEKEWLETEEKLKVIGSLLN